MMTKGPRGVKVSFVFSRSALRIARQTAELSQLDLALAAGVSVASIRRAECGKAVSLEVASSIGAALGHDFKTLLEAGDTRTETSKTTSSLAGSHGRSIAAGSPFLADAYAMPRYNALNLDDVSVLVRILTASTPQDQLKLPVDHRQILMKIPVFNGVPLGKDLDRIKGFFVSRSEIDYLINERMDAVHIFEKLDDLAFIEWESSPIPYSPKGKIKKYFSDEALYYRYLYHSKIGTVSLKSLGKRLLQALDDVQENHPREMAGPPDGVFLEDI